MPPACGLPRRTALATPVDGRVGIIRRQRNRRREQSRAPRLKADGQRARLPLTLVVPFAAKGPTDTVARALAAALGEQLGTPVVVENLAGAGGTAGAAAVASAAPDGTTLLLHHVGMATAPVAVPQPAV